MSSDSLYADLLGRTVVDRAGSKIGKVHSVFLDDDTGCPEWVTVITGVLVTQETFVPLQQARAREGKLVVVVDKRQVKFAPPIDTDHGHLSRRNERLLCQYYGLAGGHDDRPSSETAGDGDHPQSHQDAKSSSREGLRLTFRDVATWY